jgi:hypothetical protein
MNSVYRVVACWLALVLALLACVAWASPSNKWRLQMSGGADATGTLVLRLSPVDGADMDVEVAIPEGTSENASARLIRDAISAAAGKQYKTEVDDGEDVLVKRRSGQPSLVITVISNTVEGLRISIDRE